MIYTTRLKFLAALMVLPLTVQISRANPEDFTVHGVTGTNVFKLSEAKGKLVALHFLLKTECPYCIRHTHDYAKQSDGDSRVVHVFLKPDTEAEIKAWTSKLGEDSLKVTIYRDSDAALAKAYNIPDGYKFHGQTVHYPALVLLDANGKEVFRYPERFAQEALGHNSKAVHRTYAKRAEVTVPSLDDWEKEWRKNPQGIAQPKLVPVDFISPQNVPSPLTVEGSKISA